MHRPTEQRLEQERPQEEPDPQDGLIVRQTFFVHCEADDDADDEPREDGEDDEEVVQEEGVHRLLDAAHRAGGRLLDVGVRARVEPI